jgi:hypothetical protein
MSSIWSSSYSSGDGAADAISGRNIKPTSSANGKRVVFTVSLPFMSEVKNEE